MLSLLISNFIMDARGNLAPLKMQVKLSVLPTVQYKLPMKDREIQLTLPIKKVLCRTKL